jgi:hypothetical protein
LAFKRELQGITIHPRHHQYVAGMRVLNDGRDESCCIELQAVDLIRL